MVIAVAWLTLFFIVIAFLLTLALTPALGSYNAFELSSFVALFLSPIIVGYLCAQNIWEEKRTRTIADIAVLFAVLAMFMVLAEDSIVEWTPYTRAEYLRTNPTASPSALDWLNIELSALSQEMFLVIVLAFAITFIGLYIGSMLKRPVKSQK